MRKFYEKNEIWFAVIWILIYVMVMGNLRANFGDGSPYSLLGLLAIGTALTLFVVKNHLAGYYGLTKWPKGKPYLYFIPFALLCTVNFWAGVACHYDLTHQLIAIVSMALIGYIEELIFRGLLFKAIEKDSIKQAIIISAVTFGIGHIINLLTGQVSLDVFLQIIYAIAIGFSFVLFFYKSGSLLPCIITHSVINMTSLFSNAGSLSEHTQLILNYSASTFLVLVGGGYALYLLKKK